MALCTIVNACMTPPTHDNNAIHVSHWQQWTNVDTNTQTRPHYKTTGIIFTLRIVTVRKVSSLNNDNARTNCNNNTIIGDIMIIIMLTILMTIVLYYNSKMHVYNMKCHCRFPTDALLCFLNFESLCVHSEAFRFSLLCSIFSFKITERRHSSSYLLHKSIVKRLEAVR